MSKLTLQINYCMNRFSAHFSVESPSCLFTSKWSYFKFSHNPTTCNECLAFTQYTKSILYCEKPFTFYANTLSVERKLESQRTRTHQLSYRHNLCMCTEFHNSKHGVDCRQTGALISFINIKFQRWRKKFIEKKKKTYRISVFNKTRLPQHVLV